MSKALKAFQNLKTNDQVVLVLSHEKEDCYTPVDNFEIFRVMGMDGTHYLLKGNDTGKEMTINSNNDEGVFIAVPYELAKELYRNTLTHLGISNENIDNQINRFWAKPIED